jgi:hypothetical protein
MHHDLTCQGSSSFFQPFAQSNMANILDLAQLDQLVYKQPKAPERMSLWWGTASQHYQLRL